MSEKQHAPCPFCGGTELMEINSPDAGDVRAWIVCLDWECHAHGPKRTEEGVDKAIAAAWEAWDAAGKREEAK